MSLHMYRAFSPSIRSARRALVACALALAGAAGGGCAKPDELLTGTTSARYGKVAVAPWQTRAAASAEAVRPLSDGEGEVVVATAIAAHEMRRP